MKNKDSIQDMFREKLISSGLTLEDAKKLNMKVLSAKETKSLGEEFQERPSIQIFYLLGVVFNLLKKSKTDNRLLNSNSFYRVRYLDKPSGFSSMTKGGALRYMQPTGSGVHAYFPAIAPWDKILSDPQMALFITEGEFKAACACKNGYPCIGLGGVTSFQMKKKGISFLPELAALPLKGREVYIVFDSDANTKPEVAMAMTRLAEALVEHGAIPFVVSIPQINSEKTGLDDLIVNEGIQAFQEAIESAHPVGSGLELWKMSSEVVYIRNPGLIVVQSSGLKLSPAAFTQHAFANRSILVEQPLANGGTKMVKAKLAQEWIEWRCRFELEKITYAPGKPRITEDGFFNAWKGWGVEPKKGPITPWTKLLDFVFASEPEARKWFEQWCAYPLQYPGSKLLTTCLFWGTAQGTGKTLMGYTLARIYGANATEIGQEELHGNFNEWAECKQFIIADEITGSDKRAVMDRLKSFITQQTIRINMKYVPSYEVPDCINYYFTSNHPDAFFLDQEDRRAFVHEVLGPPLPDDFYAAYMEWLDNEGASHLFHYFLNLSLEGFNPKSRAPMTNAKNEMIMDVRSDIAEWVYQLVQDPERITSRLNGSELASARQLLALYMQDRPNSPHKITENGIARELKRNGFRRVNKGNPIRTEAGVMNLYSLMNPHKWARQNHATIARYWNDKFKRVD